MVPIFFCFLLVNFFVSGESVKFVAPTTFEIEWCDVFASIPQPDLEKLLAAVLQDVSIVAVRKRACVAKNCNYNTLAVGLRSYLKKRVEEERARQAALPFYQRLRVLAKKDSQLSKGLFFAKIGAALITIDFASLLLFQSVKKKSVEARQNFSGKPLVLFGNGLNIFLKKFLYPVFVPAHYKIPIAQSKLMKFNVKIGMRKPSLGFQILCDF